MTSNKSAPAIKTITFFANCQGSQLSLLFNALLRGSGIKINYLSNNVRTGEMLPEDQILARIKDSDLLVYQPLSKQHGSLSEEVVLSTIKSGCLHLSFPYIYNSGVYSLCRAPKMKNHGYGYIFGEEMIIKLFQQGHNLESILEMYQAGRIDFDLVRRFQDSLAEMRRREENTDIKLTDFIQNNYQAQKLFTTHNHPTNSLLYEVMRQILDRAELPIEDKDFKRVIIPDLPAVNCPISPFDVRIHGYQFQPHENWLEKGTELISLIIKHHEFESGHPGHTLRVDKSWQEKASDLGRRIRIKLSRIFKP